MHVRHADMDLGVNLMPEVSPSVFTDCHVLAVYMALVAGVADTPKLFFYKMLVYWGLTSQQQPGSYRGADDEDEMSVSLVRKPAMGTQCPTLFDKWHGMFYMPSRTD